MELSKVSNIFFSIGLLVAVIGAGKYTITSSAHKKTSIAFPSSITERRLAVTKATSSGSSNYNFITNFIPGIGTVSNTKDFSDLLKSRKTR